MSDNQKPHSRLVVTKRDGRLECIEEDACGMAIVGDGLSVLEAVGSWCLYSGIVSVVCNPPEIKSQFSVKKADGYIPIPTRD